MKYLVDANVLSEPTRPSPAGEVVGWLAANESELCVDSIVLGELYLGVIGLPESRRRATLERWFQAVAKTVVCLPWDLPVGMRWAKLTAELKRKGRPVPVLDSMIAATALVHGLTVATRNVDDFKPTGVAVVNPFGGAERSELIGPAHSSPAR